MDTDALIKLTKASAKEAVCDGFTVVVAPEVWRESVEQGKAGGFADAVRVEENLDAGRLALARPRRVTKFERILGELSLSGGEADTLRLYTTGRADLVVSDDSRFIKVLDGLAVPFATPGALIVALLRRRRISRKRAREYLDALSPMVGEAEYLEARRALEEE